MLSQAVGPQILLLLLPEDAAVQGSSLGPRSWNLEPGTWNLEPSLFNRLQRLDFLLQRANLALLLLDCLYEKGHEFPIRYAQ